MDSGVLQQLPLPVSSYTEHQLVLVANATDVSAAEAAVSTQSVGAAAGVVAGTALRAGSPWLWAPHVAIGVLLLLLMAASFVRFHCKYGHNSLCVSSLPRSDVPLLTTLANMRRRTLSSEALVSCDELALSFHDARKLSRGSSTATSTAPGVSRSARRCDSRRRPRGR